MLFLLRGNIAAKQNKNTDFFQHAVSSEKILDSCNFTEILFVDVFSYDSMVFAYEIEDLVCGNFIESKYLNVQCLIHKYNAHDNSIIIKACCEIK